MSGAARKVGTAGASTVADSLREADASGGETSHKADGEAAASGEDGRKSPGSSC